MESYVPMLVVRELGAEGKSVKPNLPAGSSPTEGEVDNVPIVNGLGR
jgi:hypothetical protein